MSCSQIIRLSLSTSSLRNILLLASLPFCATPLSAKAQTGRGVYFYQLPGNSYGSDEIIGTNNTAAENQMITNLKSWGITKVYGGYSTTIAANPAYVRSWNTLLANNGIASYVLLSSTNYFLPSEATQASTWLSTNFLTFNSNTTATSQRFVGVMMDVEPQAFAGDSGDLSWNASTNAGRRTYLGDFLTLIQSYRSSITSGESSSVPLDTTLPTWFYELNETIAWANQADVNSWFSSLGSAINSVSLMDYGTSSVSLIDSRYSANAALLPTGGITVALSSAIGSEWSSFTEMWDALLDVESEESLYCDINSYDTLAPDEGM